MITAPALKFIGDKEMVFPIMNDGYLLSHKDYINFYFPAIIEIIDANGLVFKFQKAELLEGIQWKASVKNISLLYKTKPILLEEPTVIEVDEMKKKVCQFISATPSNLGISQCEKTDLIEAVQKCRQHLDIIQVINSVAYWK